MLDLTEGKIKNGFYLIDEHEYKKPEAIQSMDEEMIYVYIYDEQKGRDVGQWRKRSDFMKV